MVPEAEVHPDVLAAYESASAVLEALGHDVVEIDPPFGPDMVPEFEKMWFSFACMHPVAEELEPKLRPLTGWLRERGFATSAPDFLKAQAALQLATRFAMLVTDEYDAVLTPTVTQPPVPVGWRWLSTGTRPAWRSWSTASSWESWRRGSPPWRFRLPSFGVAASRRCFEPRAS